MESNLKDLWNIVERPHIQIIGVSVGRARENGTGEIIGGKKWLRIFQNEQMTQSHRIKKP